MFNFDSYPSGLFDMYIEVGDIKKSEFELKDCVFIEIWVASHFGRNRIREECRHPARRPLYGVLNQIKEMCGNKSANILFMCDDMQDDTILWAEAIFLLLQELKKQKIVKHSILYVKDSKESAESFVQSAGWNSDQSKENIFLLLDMLSAVIYGKSNCYSESEDAYVHSETGKLPDEIKNYIQFTRKNI